MEEIIKAILKNENLKQELKVLLVKHGYYKEARDLRDMKPFEVIDLDVTKKISNEKI